MLETVKTSSYRHSRENGNPVNSIISGFPLSRDEFVWFVQSGKALDRRLAIGNGLYTTYFYQHFQTTIFATFSRRRLPSDFLLQKLVNLIGKP